MGTRRWSWIAAGILLATPGAAAEPSHDAAAFQVRITHDATRSVVERVLRGARLRLARPRCRALVDAFRDEQGRPLAAALERRDRETAAYLSDVLFYDGTRLDRCAQGATLAVAHPGQVVVFVCAEQFRAASRHYPFLAEAILIHEMLHTLGLGENPPSSREITARVLAACR